jgi:hypothetical protein
MGATVAIEKIPVFVLEIPKRLFGLPLRRFLPGAASGILLHV